MQVDMCMRSRKWATVLCSRSEVAILLLGPTWTPELNTMQSMMSREAIWGLWWQCMQQCPAGLLAVRGSAMHPQSTPKVRPFTVISMVVRNKKQGCTAAPQRCAPRPACCAPWRRSLCCASLGRRSRQPWAVLPACVAAQQYIVTTEA